MRKRISAVLAAILLILTLTPALAGSGDVNGDGRFDEEDANDLANYLVNDDVEINTIIADLDTDGHVGLSDLMTIHRLLASGERPGDGKVKATTKVYGQSAMGRDLECTIIEPERYDRTVLAVFAMHGFEGFYDRDGQTLVDAANAIIEYFEAQDTMYGCRLIVVPCANPDGLEDGTSAKDFGHNNKRGINLNRDFDVAYESYPRGENHTPHPFSAPESCALRDLVLKYTPDVVLDFHGFDSYTIGDSELSVVFEEEMDRIHLINFNSKYHGNFAFWAREQGAMSLMVYMPDPDFSQQKLIRAMERIVAHNYPEKNGRYALDPVFAAFENLSCYALDFSNIKTYVDMNGAETGYISGQKDWTILEQIYDNRWARVRYPIKEGFKIGYAYFGAYVDDEMRIEPLEVPGGRARNIPVYTRQRLNYQWDSIDRDATFYVVAETEEALQVIYPSKDTWKMGWIRPNSIDRSTCKAYHYGPDGSDETAEEKRSYTATLFAAGVQIDGGQAFDLPVYVEAEAMASLRLWVEYDGEAIELYGVDDGGTMTGFVQGDNMEADPYKVMWVRSEGADEPLDGKLVTFHFRARPTTKQQETPLLVYAKSGDALTSNLERVKITLAPYEGGKD